MWGEKMIECDGGYEDEGKDGVNGGRMKNSCVRENGKQSDPGCRFEAHGESVGYHWFLAVCEMCFFRYWQHSSRDKPLGPLTPTLPSLSTHHAGSCLLKCVCVWASVCVRVYAGRGSACPVPQHSQGATGKTALNLRETESVRKRVEGQQACQSRPSLLE